MVAALIGRLASAPSAIKDASWSSARNTEDGPAEIGNVATSAPITGPERSVITDADTTKAAVIAMRSARIRMKGSSGDILIRRPGQAKREPGPQAFVLRKNRRTAFSKTREHGVWVPAQGRDDNSHTR